LSKEKSIGNRIRYVEDDDELRIEIQSGAENHKVNILLGWLILWIVVGISMVYYLFTQEITEQNTKIVIYVFFGFWLYYFYKVFRSYRWLSKGVEDLVLDKEFFVITNRVGRRGLPIRYPIKEISKITIRQVEVKSFQYQMENSFWVIGGDRLQFNSGNSSIFFGKRLEEQEARKLIKLINERLKRIVSKVD
jgi:hypothetical protein